MFLKIENYERGSTTFVEVVEYEIFPNKGEKDCFKAFELGYKDSSGKWSHPQLIKGQVYVMNSDGKTVDTFNPKNVVLPE